MSGDKMAISAVFVEYSSNFEKKRRNLLKRKTRLEIYMETLEKGGSLTPDQEKAVKEYDSVCQLVDMLEETNNIITEIRAKCERIEKDNEARIANQREKYAIDVLRRIYPVLDLLAKAQLPAVKSAIINATSAQQYKFIENASKILAPRIPNSFKIENLDSSDLFKLPAEYLYKLASGAQVPVSGKNGKSKSPTFAELQQTCIDLLSNSEVRAAVACPLADTKQKPAQSKSSSAASSKPEVETVSTVEPVHAVEKPAPIPPADAILQSVINPLKANFNFLQASHVSSVAPHVVAEPRAVHSYAQVTPHHAMPQQQPHLVAPVVAQSVPVPHMPAPVSSKPEGEQVASAVSQKVAHVEAPAVKPAEVKVKAVEPQAAEKNTAKQKTTKVAANGATSKQEQHVPSQTTSLQAVMDAELAQQQLAKPASASGPKSWADRVRGESGAQPSHQSAPPAQAAAPRQPVQSAPAARSPPSAAQNEQREHQFQPRGKPRQPYNAQEGGNNARQGPPPRGGFRGSGRARGNGAPFRGGGRGRGGMRGSFHPRGGFNGQQAPRQPPMQAAS